MGPLALAPRRLTGLAPDVDQILRQLRDEPALDQQGGAVDLYWIPLGAGGRVVKTSGKLFEAVSALVQRRAPCDLYHSAIEVFVPEGRFVIEVTPVPDGDGEKRGVVAQGPVGTSWAGRLRVFRYEVRRWLDGVIPDADEAVCSPVRVADGLACARRLLDLVPALPTPVWGRDELETGDMWNSNSVVSWLLKGAGVDTSRLRPPPGGRAPGWEAGLVVADRDERDGLVRMQEQRLSPPPSIGRSSTRAAPRPVERARAS